ncbi:MAG: hypothetical protein KL839_05075 [Rhizobium sp.]|nr:hypothetical protein [Rhizobium sp.]
MRLTALADDGRADTGRASITPRSTSTISIYYAAPKKHAGPKSLDEVDPELLKVYEKLGIPLKEQEILAGVETVVIAVDAVFDSVSVVTTFKAELAKAGVIFMSISEAVREYPDLVKQYLGSVVPVTDNYYRDAESRRLYRRFLRLHPEGRSLPDGACRPISASTRRTPASSSAR